MIKSGAFLFLSGWRTSHFRFYGIQLQWLECSAASLLPERQRTPQGQKLHPPHILNEPLSLFIEIQLQWLESVGHFTPSDEAKALLCREFQCPKILSEPLSLLFTFVTIVKIEEGRYMPKGSGKVIAQNKKLFMIISSKKHTKQGLSFKERKLSQFALDE